MIVIHVITRFMRGGADENTALSCNEQVRNGRQVYLIFGRDFSAEMLATLDHRVRIVRVPELVREVSLHLDLLALFRLVALFAQIKPHIVHTHTSKAGAVGRLAALFARCPVIIHGVHILPFVEVSAVQRFFYLFIERILAPTTHAFVSVSDGMRAICIEQAVGSTRQHHVIASGMNLSSFSAAAPLSESELRELIPHYDQDRPLVVLASALERRKRQYDFLPVFKQVLLHHPTAVLVLLGEGADKDAILERIDALGLNSNVYLAGFRDDLARWLAAASVCILTSEREGLPRVVVQYVAASKPVVVTALPGIGEVVRHDHNGFVVKLDDLPRFADYISLILSSPKLAERLAQGAKEVNLEPWDARRMTSELETLYEALLKAKPRRLDRA